MPRAPIGLLWALVVCATSASAIGAAQVTPQSSKPTPVPATTPAATPQSEIPLREPRWLTIYIVEPDRTAEFEAVAARIREGMRQAGQLRRRQADAARLLRSNHPNPAGKVLYFWEVPASEGSSGLSLLALLRETLPGESAALEQRLKDSLDPANPSVTSLLRVVF
jgi:hypothetical protein